MTRFSLMLVGWLVLAGLTAHAGSFQVVPVRVYLDPRSNTAVVRVLNNGEQQLTVQLEAKRWRQNEAGEDVYEDTTEIVFFPLLFTIAPGDERVVRIGYRGPPLGDTERTYRLFLEELPVVTPGRSELRFALRIGVPIFLTPEADRKEWSATSGGIQEGQAVLRVRNGGSRHMVLTQLTALGKDDAGAALFNKSRDGWYVLAGSTKAFALPLDETQCRALGTLTMTAIAGEEQREVEIPPPAEPEHCTAPPERTREAPDGAASAN